MFYVYVPQHTDLISTDVKNPLWNEALGVVAYQRCGTIPFESRATELRPESL